MNQRLRYLLILQKNALLRQVYKLRDAVPDGARRGVRNWLFTHCGGLFADLPAYQKWQLNPGLPSYGLARYPSPSQRPQILQRHYMPAPTTPGILFISHDRGGGTEAHVQTLARAVEQEGCRVWMLRAISKTRVRLSALDDTPEHNLVFGMDEPDEALQTALSHLNIRHTHLHHTLDLPQAVLEHIPHLTKALGVDYDFTAHDYFSICPRFALFDEGVQAYCGEPTADKCTLCVGTYGSTVGKDINVERWRARYSHLLEGARAVFVPAEDVKARLQRYFPSVTFHVRPHPDAAPDIIPAPVTRGDNDVLQVLLLGAIAPYKGSQTLLRIAQDADGRGLPIHFTIIGHTDIDWQLARLKNITITGSYQPEALPQKIRDGGFHLSLFLNVIPETYSFTLSEVLRDGIFPVAFDIGAIAERLRAVEWGSLMPLTACVDASRINDHLLACTPSAAPVERIRRQFTAYNPFLAQYYGLDLAQLSTQRRTYHEPALA